MTTNKNVISKINLKSEGDVQIYINDSIHSWYNQVIAAQYSFVTLEIFKSMLNKNHDAIFIYKM